MERVKQMKKKSIQLFVILFAIIAAATLAACRGESEEPISTATETPSEVMLTEAAVTILAQLTQSVMDEFTATPTSPPPTLTATATLPPPTPTGPTFTPTETPLPTTTPLPTNTPIPSFTPLPTLGPDDPKRELGEPDSPADFTKDSDWVYFNEPFGRFQIDGGHLLMTAKKTEALEVWSLSWPYLSDFYLEFETLTGKACYGHDRYGMVVRAPDTEAGYLFGISCDGEYNLRYWDAKELAFTELIGWTSTQYINIGPNQINYLGIKAQGDRISVYINGHLLNELSDTTQLEGKFGAFIKAESTPGFQVRLVKVKYWNLGE